MNIRLFIKPGCPWCYEAMDWLNEHGWPYEALDVIRDQEAREEMYELTRQTKAPSIEIEGEVLADFGADELEEWWTKKNWPLHAP